MMCELRYFQTVQAIAKDPAVLWLLKCRYIMQDLFQSPSELEIYFDGKTKWIFDYLPTKEQASRILAESCFNSFDVARIRKGMVKVA